MSSITITLPDELDAAVAERVQAIGATSTEEYLLQLIEEDCAGTELERVLLNRSEGPFIPLDPDGRRR